MSEFALAAVLGGTILVASTISVEGGLSVALIELAAGVLITVVVLSAIVPTAIAQRFFQPHPELGRVHRRPVEEFWPETDAAR